jgi:hypothetical protein
MAWRPDDADRAFQSRRSSGMGRLIKSEVIESLELESRFQNHELEAELRPDLVKHRLQIVRMSGKSLTFEI